MLIQCNILTVLHTNIFKWKKEGNTLLQLEASNCLSLVPNCVIQPDGD